MSDKLRSAPPKEERHASLDLLRILATLFVIILHYNNTDLGKAFLYAENLPKNYCILVIFEIISICAVNVFVMISGYFLCTASCVRPSKAVQLFIDVAAISLLRYALYCCLGIEAFSLRALLSRLIPLSWYVSVYVGLYLVSPFLNQILRNTTRSQFRFLLAVFFFVLSVWPSGVEFISKALDFSPKSLSPISSQGSCDGYTLVNFILMYFFGAYCRMYGSYQNSSTAMVYAALVYLGSTLLNTVYASFFLGRATSYCNPLVIIQAVAIFVFFQNISIRCKAVSIISSCSFGVYLMHSFFLRFYQIERFVTGNA